MAVSVDGGCPPRHETRMARQVVPLLPPCPLPPSPPAVVLIVADAMAFLLLEGHTNCIWSLAVPGTQQPLLASASADRTVKIWDTRVHSRSPLRASFRYADSSNDPWPEKVNPTCVSWSWDGRGIIVGWENANVELWDVEKGFASAKWISSESTGVSLSTSCC
jgi:WD40 repeat protein